VSREHGAREVHGAQPRVELPDALALCGGLLHANRGGEDPIEVGQPLCDQGEEPGDVRHHHEGVPETACRKQSARNVCRRLLPKPANQGKAPRESWHRRGRLDPTVLGLGAVGGDAEQNDQVGPEADGLKGRVDVRHECRIVRHVVI
jgi:hypothetical protein